MLKNKEYLVYFLLYIATLALVVWIFFGCHVKDFFFMTDDWFHLDGVTFSAKTLFFAKEHGLWWRPFPELFDQLIQRGFGLSHVPQFVVNLALHGLNTILGAYIVFKLTNRWSPALIFSLLFATFYMHYDCLFIACYRDNLLSTLFFQSATVLYLQYYESKRGIYYKLFLLSSLLLLATKEFAFILPVYLTVISVVLVYETDYGIKRLWNVCLDSLRTLLPLYALVMAWIILELIIPVVFSSSRHILADSVSHRRLSSDEVNAAFLYFKLLFYVHFDNEWLIAFVLLGGVLIRFMPLTVTKALIIFSAFLVIIIALLVPGMAPRWFYFLGTASCAILGIMINEFAYRLVSIVNNYAVNSNNHKRLDFAVVLFSVLICSPIILFSYNFIKVESNNYKEMHKANRELYKNTYNITSKNENEPITYVNLPSSKDCRIFPSFVCGLPQVGSMYRVAGGKGKSPECYYLNFGNSSSDSFKMNRGEWSCFRDPYYCEDLMLVGELSPQEFTKLTSTASKQVLLYLPQGEVRNVSGMSFQEVKKQYFETPSRINLIQEGELRIDGKFVSGWSPHDYLKDDSFLMCGSPFTMGFWIFIKERQRPLAVIMDNNYGTKGMTIRFNNNSRGAFIEVGIGGSTRTSKGTTSGTKLSIDKWHYVVVVNDGQDLYIYFDDYLAGIGKDQKAEVIPSRGLSVGRKYKGGHSLNSSTVLTGVFIDSKALTAAEIRETYEREYKHLIEENKNNAK